MNPIKRSISQHSADLLPGYKQTEVGVIPEEWNAVPMEAITTHIGDGLHGTPIYASNGDFFFLNGNNLQEGKIVVTSETRSVNHSEFTKYQKPLSHRSILMSINGTIGNIGLFNGERVVLSKSAAYINVKPDVSRQFIYHFLQTEIVRQQFLDGLTGSTIGNLGLATIRRTQIALPPTVVEQRAIAKALSDMDALLEGLDQLIAKKRDIKQATMQQLLTGKMRLPGFHDAWIILTAGEIGKFHGGFGFPIQWQGKHNGTYPFFKVSDMNNDGNEDYMTAANNYISESVQRRLGANIFPQGSIVLAKVGAAIFLERKKILGQPSCIDNNMTAYVMDTQRVDVRFIHALLLLTRLGDLVSTTALPSINGNQLSGISISLPSLHEQKAIVAILSEMDTELAVLEHRRDKTTLLKQAMMQELLTGRIRLV